MVSQLDYKIGTYAGGEGGMAYVHTLCDAIPQSIFYPGSKEYWKADGTRYFDGVVRCTWKFTAIQKAGVAALRDICSGESAEVYITTRTDEYDESDDETFATYTAVMHWPLNAHEKRIAMGLYANLEIEFTNLVEVT